ncbi:hypothetical protein EVAR_35561_1 [Eumeta japonica]|uniref:Uncharacterized protein n=1 Tax=Eumeta variegata TaxID=151549 RepID=A0A4C1XMD9_EUMVA|nr:hypothetical protein EVAR_35561_1 [Eumeta japonica]
MLCGSSRWYVLKLASARGSVRVDANEILSSSVPNTLSTTPDLGPILNSYSRLERLDLGSVADNRSTPRLRVKKNRVSGKKKAQKKSASERERERQIERER